MSESDREDTWLVDIPDDPRAWPSDPPGPWSDTTTNWSYIEHDGWLVFHPDDEAEPEKHVKAKPRATVDPLHRC